MTFVARTRRINQDMETVIVDVVLNVGAVTLEVGGFSAAMGADDARWIAAALEHAADYIDRAQVE